MTIVEFAHTYCEHMLREVSAEDLYQQIADKDDLPYDDIIINESGVPAKILYVDDDGRTIEVLELLAYSKEDVLRTKDYDLIQLWENYMEQIDVQEANLEDLLQLVKDWTEARKREDSVDGLSS